MAIVDLSHRLNNTTPVYPGMGAPQFKKAALLADNGYRETRMCFDSHLGTHIDAPAHMLAEGITLDQMPLEAFYGEALIITVPDGSVSITKEFLSYFNAGLQGVEFVLFHTGWSRYWGTPRYFEGFPVLTQEAVEWLTEFPLKGIGFDVISADSLLSTDYPNHFILFHKGMIIIENLIFPPELTVTRGTFSCLPIPYEDADGSPVRAVIKFK